MLRHWTGQRQLLESLAEMMGKPPLYQEDLDNGTIDFAQLWQENLQELERLVADVRALPGRLGVSMPGEVDDSPSIQSVDLPLNVVQVGLILEVSGQKKGMVKKAIEERVLSPYQMVKLKPRGNEYELMFATEKDDALSATTDQMRWEIDLLAELDDCSVKVVWLGDVTW